MRARLLFANARQFLFGVTALKRFPVIEIRSVELGTPDLAKSEAFYTKVWGLQLQDRDDNAVYLRASGRDHHVLALRAHVTSEVLSVTFRTAAAEGLSKLTDSVQDAGGTVIRPVEPNAAPDGGTVVTLRTPEGFILRLVHGDALHTEGGPGGTSPCACRT